MNLGVNRKAFHKTVPDWMDGWMDGWMKIAASFITEGKDVISCSAPKLSNCNRVFLGMCSLTFGLSHLMRSNRLSHSLQWASLEPVEIRIPQQMHLLLQERQSQREREDE